MGAAKIYYLLSFRQMTTGKNKYSSKKRVEAGVGFKKLFIPTDLLKYFATKKQKYKSCNS